MIGAVIVATLTCLALMLCVLFKPTIKIKNIELQTFWIISLTGALLVILLGVLPFSELVSKLSENSVVNPFKILILFISLSMISITLDSLGFFKYLAVKVANRFNNPQYALFFSLLGLIIIM